MTTLFGQDNVSEMERAKPLIACEKSPARFEEIILRDYKTSVSTFRSSKPSNGTGVNSIYGVKRYETYFLKIKSILVHLSNA